MALIVTEASAPTAWEDGLDWDKPTLGDARYLQACQLALAERFSAAGVTSREPPPPLRILPETEIESMTGSPSSQSSGRKRTIAHVFFLIV